MLVVTSGGMPQFFPIERLSQFPRLKTLIRIVRAVFCMTDRLAAELERNSRLAGDLDAFLVTHTMWPQQRLRRIGIVEIPFFCVSVPCCDATGEATIEERAYRAYCLERPDIQELAWFQSTVVPRVLNPTPGDVVVLLAALGVRIEAFQDTARKQAFSISLEALQVIRELAYPTPKEPTRHQWIERILLRSGHQPCVVRPTTANRSEIEVGVETLRVAQRGSPARTALERVWRPHIAAAIDVGDTDGEPFEDLIERSGR